jgi:hypothetical protein
MYDGVCSRALAATVIEMTRIVSIASGEHRSAGCQSPQPERPTKEVHCETKRDDNNGHFDQALDRIA